ncbi:FixH family protein [Carboxylicivirga sp. N1Y90]|uniref:FixH family protein n=1 Tax=Carboxylicivirga fragile TaxID=3417571 RepID=UPI003D33C0F0|nr:FixH family protein [Marinilabiliaceae bacterium N1Y90]
MKFNWGHGIFLAIVLGASGLATLVFITTRERIDMVTEEYYPKELKYQDQISKIINYQALAKKVEVSSDNDLVISFPEITGSADGIEGEVHIYRPSNKALDIERTVALDSAFSMSIAKKHFKAGKYELMIEWQANEVAYFTKLPLYID